MSINVDKKFAYPGSKMNFSPLYRFKLTHMYLRIKPDFKKKLLADCLQKLTFEALYDIQEIILDSAELNIHSVSAETKDIKIESFDSLRIKDKLVIKFTNGIVKGTKFTIKIKYSAGYIHNKFIRSPRSGFNFIVHKNTPNTPASQSWTQGEAVESRYWFPSIDDPQVKFTREIEVIAPDEEYDVISNGVFERKGKVWHWKENNPIPSYLTSVVIGKFNKKLDTKNIPSLRYYWPYDIPKKDAMRTFQETPDIIKYLEGYLQIGYPYNKYWQVAVDKFEFGGMENTNCTTLTRNIFHDARGSLDYSRDIIIVAHEIAHQWFGNLISCKDWSNLWLNEGFADYFETRYWASKFTEKYKGKKTNDEFLWQIIQKIDTYIEETETLYKRPIVTNLYKHPDELFDAHSYEKGGLVLHMLNQFIGEENFKKSIKNYLEIYKGKTVQTLDFQESCEKICGINLKQFFYQWLFIPGHPELDIQFRLEHQKNHKFNDIKKLKIKITQKQQDDSIFIFPIEIRCLYHNGKNRENIKEKIETILVNERTTEHTFEEEMTGNTTIELISVDPELKILKEIKSFTIENQTEKFNLYDILKNVLHKKADNITTIAERIAALKLIKENSYFSNEILDLLKDILLNTSIFYAVSVEAANVTGSYHDIKDYNKDSKAYTILKKCLTDERFHHLAPQTKKAIIQNLGKFEREDTLDLKNKNSIPLLILLLNDKSYFVQNAAATAIGKCIKNMPDGIKIKKEMLKILIDKVESITFQDQLAQGAINGLSELANDENIELVENIVDLLINKSSKKDENTNIMNRYFVRATSTLALGKFLITKNQKILNDKNLKRRAELLNQRVLNHLIRLLKDESRRIKRNACTALADPESRIIEPNQRILRRIEELKKVAEEDLDGFVRRTAEFSLNVVRGWIKEWTDKEPALDIKLRGEPFDKLIFEKKRVEKKESNKKAEADRDKEILKVARRDTIEY